MGEQKTVLEAFNGLTGECSGRIVWAVFLGCAVLLGFLPGCDGTQEDADPCINVTCSNHGSCSNQGGVAICTCEANWTGDVCDTCAEGYAGGNCDTCAAGYYEYPAGSGLCVDDPCLPDPCSGHGDCANDTGASVCTCHTGWDGAACDTCAAGYYEYPAGSELCVDDPCLPDPCSGHGDCANDTGSAVCTCIPGWTGVACDQCGADVDGDGWNRCQGDCCETTEHDGCTAPSKVNPGAYDFAGNNLDDNCDGTVDNPYTSLCSAGARLGNSSAIDLVQSMDLCLFAQESPPLPEDRTWGVIEAQIYQADGTTPPDQLQTAVLLDFGAAVTPPVNSTMAVLSSGTARDELDPGYVNPNDPSFEDPSNSGTAPTDYTSQHGGELQSYPLCPSGGTNVNDVVELFIRVRVPTNAIGFTFYYRFYSAEFPEWCCSQYNDFFLALVYSGNTGIPADHNVAYDAMNNPVSVNLGAITNCEPVPCNYPFSGTDNDDDGCPDNLNCSSGYCSSTAGACPEGVTGLVGTGYPTNDAGATSWLAAQVPAVPAEIVTLRFYIWDTSDHKVDSLVLLDGFQWILDPSD
jgi:hypothetical protein